MRWRHSPIVICLLSSAVAIACREKDHRIPAFHQPEDYETKTCEGDYCLVLGIHITGVPTPSRQTCLGGKSIDYLNGRCGYYGGSTPYCVCNSTLCSDTVQLPRYIYPRGNPLASGNLTCGSSRNCLACGSYVANGRHNPSQYCESQWFTDIEHLLRPSSCARFQYSSSGYSRCVCDTRENCADKLIREQALTSKTVKCYSEWNGDATCQGNRCFVLRGHNGSTTQYRGCLTNNDTLAPHLYPNGYVLLMDNEFIICNSSLCNLSWKTASDSISGATEVSSTTSVEGATDAWTTSFEGGTDAWTTSVEARSTTTPPIVPPVNTTVNAVSSSTTTIPSRQTLFEYEYMKFFTNIQSAINNFIAKFAELYG
ncbi:hypothetical protein PMAYCL1PPCAC_11455 [Pristionchus mayeri]|uniref:DUF7622 domain-containing protein n=1 Tax=Pristionchus mayeri TaxID=1317129 RepID=A0AAN4ZP82_9BILA|nr:hypothetical protein PMAYCL1PPCAC_11455 [Pristionchus mayeri]